MDTFSYVRPELLDAAVSAGNGADAYYIGGGTNLVDLMKGGIARPAQLVDVNHLGLDQISELPDGGLRIGAAARNSDVANHALVRERYPLLSMAMLAGASPQLRNMATVGGNLLQRTRCDYFVDRGFAHCNKRAPGSGCAAREGLNRTHAILGASAQCVAVNPSDMNVALLALGARVNVHGQQGERRIAIADFHRLPGDHPEQDTTLQHGELITSVDLPKSNFAAHSHYLKVRDRASFAFALVSAAIALDVAGDQIRDARIALGGVAHKPWLADTAAQRLVGKLLRDVDVQAIGALAVEGAQPLQHNVYKVQLARNTVARALTTAMAAA
jgi:xanthine dehydrogenase YagS FAD-binding subunit